MPTGEIRFFSPVTFNVEENVTDNIDITDMTPKAKLWIKSEITSDMIYKAEQCLIDNGIEEDEASLVLQALGYVLLDVELYEDYENEDFDSRM